MNKLFLNMVMLPSSLWKNLGADNVQLRAILQTKLILDDRKPLAMALGKQQKVKKEQKYGSVRSSLIFLMLGVFYMFPIMIVPDRIFSLTMYFSLLISAIVLMLITDFSNVLFDSRDKFILFPRPVNDRTLVLARLLHVFIYLLRIIIPISLPGWIALGWFDGWKSATLFPVVIVLMVLLSLFIVNSVYLLVLRLTKPEKFKDIINYFQVVASIVFFISTYLMPRMFDADPTHFSILNYPWVRNAPSYWLAVCWSWIGYPVALSGSAVYSVLAVVLPLACMFVLVKWLAPQFAQRIGGIDVVGTEGYTPVAKRTSRSKLYQKLADAFNHSDEAKAGFMIAWLQTARSRSFRMRVYPTFAYIPVYFGFIIFSSKHSVAETLHRLSGSSFQLFPLYMSSFVMISVLGYLAASDQYKAAWVYYAGPVATPGRIMIGAMKAMWLKFFLPFFIAISVFVLCVWGPQAIWDVLLALVNVTLFIVSISRINPQLPFSQAEQMKQGAGRILKSFFAMIMPMALGAGHYFAMNLWWLKAIFLILSAILLWLVADSYANTPWSRVIKAQQE
jgi:ABC-2 type transport system permease protein